MVKCDCMNIRHSAGRCTSNATKRCTDCGDLLCGHCTREHHYCGREKAEPLSPSGGAAVRPERELVLV